MTVTAAGYDILKSLGVVHRRVVEPPERIRARALDTLPCPNET
jgi:hypothetical protein